ncbi:MAG: Na+/H+ antiporter subunit E [Polaromonas sp.]|uniref:Na+/H+ antiporter subunit E n=1 Tax=Polaromonas sp. TaxID=1869339 RepID=UPI002733F24D|nr:Na+/H+ antiporter subunit E [Polaromonas sp.]MDP2818370.1 Na+/H+ antiporter subunit E [Polaromonas sp.]
MNKIRQRLLPSPLLSLVLALIWPVLNQSWSLGHMLLGALLALLIPVFTERLRADRAVLRRPGVALRLLFIVLKDIITSNIDVARLILGRESAIRPGFFWLPLSITDPHGIVTLAGIITMTPGTLSADLSADRQHLLVHAFNIDDEAALIASIKSRYEAPLMEIFK